MTASKKVDIVFFKHLNILKKSYSFLIYENLFLNGRNGIYRYNNMDHSMFTAIVAV
jgi:UDP-galactopyranose mutase